MPCSLGEENALQIFLRQHQSPVSDEPNPALQLLVDLAEKGILEDFISANPDRISREELRALLGLHPIFIEMHPPPETD